MNGARGEMGVRGPVGDRGWDGDGKEYYVLSYAGVSFRVSLKPSVFQIIEDATKVNQEELRLIRVIDEEEWENIRNSWGEVRLRQKVHAEFEKGGF